MLRSSLGRLFESRYAEWATELVRRADLGITGAEMVDADGFEQTEHGVKLARPEVQFRHAGPEGDTLLPLSAESDGTLSWVSMLFASHDVTMLGAQFGSPLLERDQIWFAEKDQTGATELYSLAELKPRKGENIERGYLAGRYGATPGLSPGELGRVLRALRDETA